MAGHEWRDDIPEKGAGADHTEDGEGEGPSNCDLHAGISTLVTGAGQAWLIRNLIPLMLGTDLGGCHSVGPWSCQSGRPRKRGERQGPSTLLRGSPTVLLVLLNQEP